MSGKTISHDDYLRLVGLFTLFNDQRVQLERLEAAIGRLVEEPDERGQREWTSDVLWGYADAGQADPGELLRRLEIKVAEPE